VPVQFRHSLAFHVMHNFRNYENGYFETRLLRATSQSFICDERVKFGERVGKTIDS